VQVPEKTVPIPGIELLNSQFGFILERNAEDNYTASVKLLTNDDVSQITQSNTLFVNASDVATKNAWHKAVTKVSADTVNIDVYDENGTRLDGKTSDTASNGLSELAVVMTYPVGQVLAFKNLKVEAVSRNPTPIVSSEIQGNGFEFLFPYVRMLLLLAGAVLAVVCLRERIVNEKHSEGVHESSQR
jgi:hypothetical protein